MTIKILEPKPLTFDFGEHGQFTLQNANVWKGTEWDGEAGAYVTTVIGSLSGRLNGEDFSETTSSTLPALQKQYTTPLALSQTCADVCAAFDLVAVTVLQKFFGEDHGCTLRATPDGIALIRNNEHFLITDSELPSSLNRVEGAFRNVVQCLMAVEKALTEAKVVALPERRVAAG